MKRMLGGVEAGWVRKLIAFTGFVTREAVTSDGLRM